MEISMVDLMEDSLEVTINTDEWMSPRDKCIDSNLKLLRSGQHSDCKVICRTSEWKVHQAILCPRNAYFDRVFTGSFKTRQEALTKTVIWNDEEPFAVEGLLIFLYTGTDPTTKIKSVVPMDERSLYIALLQIADKRQVPDLYNLAIRELRGRLKRNDSAAFIETARMIWSMEIPVPEELKKEVEDLAMVGKLRGYEGDEFRCLFGEEGSLARTLVAGFVRKPAVPAAGVVMKQVDVERRRLKARPLHRAK